MSNGVTDNKAEHEAGVAAESPRGTPEERAELSLLQTPAAVRQRAHALLKWVLAGNSAHFTVDPCQIGRVAERVLELTCATYGDPSKVPFHSRWRHLEVDGGERSRALQQAVRGDRLERLQSELDLVLISVLLDAGAGPQWRYQTRDGKIWTRSEGLAVASFDAFLAGAFAEADSTGSSRSPAQPVVDASRLARITAAELGALFQVTPDNPLLGLEGRAALLQRLGETVLRDKARFPGDRARPGNLLLTANTRGAGRVEAGNVLAAVLTGLGSIWPARHYLCGVALGDVWPHRAMGWVPFHKLSQWLTYSLCETLERSGCTLAGVEQLTGLAEYRNGGLMLDSGILLPRNPSVLQAVHTVDSELVVEWRALTVALLDEVADAFRARTGQTAAELPLARVLEGGTWALGRQLAATARAGGGSPLQVQSDGTVF